MINLLPRNIINSNENKKNKPYFIIVLSVNMVLLISFLFIGINKYEAKVRVPEYSSIQSIDTMKYSRDLSRQELHNPLFDTVIYADMAKIAKTGANYVAIGTPYDDEFIPYLKRWVKAARENNLKIWFRGNFSGWEGWFGYEKISAEEHKIMIRDFILSNPELFKDGDLFSSCPECENGQLGDPRNTGRVQEYRQFLIDEYIITKGVFSIINTNVSSNYFSMNADVAQLIMDRETTKTLGGIVVIDHYVNTPERLIHDVLSIQNKSGGRVMLGEFGSPIPGITGEQDEEDQAEWLRALFLLLNDTDGVVGINYWVNRGGSTALWNNDGTARKAQNVISYYFNDNNMKTIFKNSEKNTKLFWLF